MMHYPKTLRLIGTAALLMVAGACSSTTDAGIVTNVDVRGTWHYTATQSSPIANLVGTLTVTDYSAGNFSGKLEANETDAAGNPHPRAGIVTGRTLSGPIADFDAFLSVVSRRHVGRVTADTMSGNWTEQGGGSGTFRAVRTSR